MQVFKNLNKPISKKPTSVTIGNFDGIHLGHQQLISSAVAAAKRAGQKSVVVTFFPNPRTVIRKEEPFLLTSDTEKLEQLSQLGVDIVVIVDFNQETLQLRTAQFVNLLSANLTMHDLWIGYDFKLGYQREGNHSLLRKLGEEFDYTVYTVSPVLLSGLPVSSTRIREALRAGEIPQANACLGRFFQVPGLVISTKPSSSKKGFSVSTLRIQEQHAIPRDGFYKYRAKIDGYPHNSIVYFETLQRDYSVETIASIQHPYSSRDLVGQLINLDVIYAIQPIVNCFRRGEPMAVHIP